MPALVLRLPVDCAGCVAPCCRNLRLAAPEQGRLLSLREAAPLWRAAGADLVEVLPRTFACTALRPGGGCAVHRSRPQPCRDYDCRDVRLRPDAPGPHCLIPVPGGRTDAAH